MPRFEDHDCLLAHKEEEVINYFLDSGYLITIRRTLRSLCMISRSHPYTSRYFKSYSACRNEEIRQLTYHYNMIHPFSMFNLYWEFYMFFLFTALYLVIPVTASILVISQYDAIYLIKFSLDVLHLFDVIKIFFTGYYNHQKSKVTTKISFILKDLHEKCGKRYITTYFIFDVLSCANTFIFPVRFFVNIPPHISLPIRTIGLTKIVRVTRWLSILELFRQYGNFSSYVFKSIKVVLVFFVASLWAFSFNFFLYNFFDRYVNKLEGEDQWKRDVVKDFFDATRTIMLVGVGDPEQIPEYLNAVLFTWFGFALQMFVYAQIIQVWTKYANADNKRTFLYKQFEEYMKYHELHLSLRGRFTSYFQFKFHKHFFKESEINNMISPFIRQEILMHVTRSHIEKVDFFKHLPENVLMRVVAHLKSEIYLPGDVIITAGTTGTSMFFIYHGTVAIFTPNGKEICHLEDGSHFGEIGLILSETRVANVIAVTASELFTLSRTDFFAAIEPYPECKEQLIALATERLYNAIAQE